MTYGSSGSCSMQHGFASRNGLLAAYLARSNYTGIEGVLESPYGGFLNAFGGGDLNERIKNIEGILKELGTTWYTRNIVTKPYPLMAALHGSVDCIRGLQTSHPAQLSDLSKICKIEVAMGDAAFNHGGWKFDPSKIEVTAAQMNVSYAVSIQLLDKEVLPSSFSAHRLGDPARLELISKTECSHREELDKSLKTDIKISFSDGTQVDQFVEWPRGTKPPMTNEEIIAKFDSTAGKLLDKDRSDKIKDLAAHSADLEDFSPLITALQGQVGNILA